jgi:hypothetical protein
MARPCRWIDQSGSDVCPAYIGVVDGTRASEPRRARWHLQKRKRVDLGKNLRRHVRRRSRDIRSIDCLICGVSAAELKQCDRGGNAADDTEHKETRCKGAQPNPRFATTRCCITLDRNTGAACTDSRRSFPGNFRFKNLLAAQPRLLQPTLEIDRIEQVRGGGFQGLVVWPPLPCVAGRRHRSQSRYGSLTPKWLYHVTPGPQMARGSDAAEGDSPQNQTHAITRHRLRR